MAKEKIVPYFTLENIPDIAWFKDLESRYLAVNAAFARISGLAVKETIGKTDDELWPGEIAKKYRDADQQVIRSGQTAKIEEAVKDPVTGEIILLETIKTPLRDSTGATIGTIGISRDVTERKYAEMQLREVTRQFQIIFDSIPATIWFKDTKNNFVRVNKATLDLMGCAREDIEGKSAYDFFPKHEAEKYFKDDSEVIRSKRPKIGIIEEAHTAKGDVRTVRTDKIPSFDDQGNVTGLVAIATDITDLKNAEHEAVLANQSKDRFLAMLSHELRTPLTAILSWAELLAMNPTDPKKVEKAAAKIKQAANSQNRLIDDLLDVSRVISGKLQVEVSQVKLTDPITLAVESLTPVARARDIELVTEFAEDSDDWVIGDPTRLQQVFHNILMNAIKFTPAKGKISVGIDRAERSYRVRIRDTGVGLDRDALSHLFDPFWQADTSSTRKQGGLGLGLTIVRNLVEAQGGTVSAESPGEDLGSVFTVTIPMASASPLRSRVNTPAVAAKNERIKEDRRHAQCERLKGLRVLVVDDEESACEAFRQILGSYGLDVRTATSSESAIKELKSFDASVLVSDIAMPGEDGYELLRRIRNSSGERAKIPAIALTAFASREDAQKALQAGFYAHIAKPVDGPVLLDAIARATDH